MFQETEDAELNLEKKKSLKYILMQVSRIRKPQGSHLSSLSNINFDISTKDKYLLDVMSPNTIKKVTKVCPDVFLTTAHNHGSNKTNPCMPFFPPTLKALLKYQLGFLRPHTDHHLVD